VHIAVNWLVQGVLVAVAAAVVLRAIPRSRPRARYAIAWIAYLEVLILPVVPSLLSTVSDAGPLNLIPTGAAPMVTVPAHWWMSPALAIGLWIAWSCIHTVRLAAAALAVRHARNGRECPAAVLARLPQWSRISGIGRQTTVILSDEVRAAAVLGMGTPTIALAPALIERLSDDDLDRVLVHEWAHVQRHDDVAQLAQRIISIVVGWHPAAWWLERRLEFEREAACDEIAVCVTGSAKRYAACLARLAALPGAPPRLIAALGAVSASGFRERLLRILAAPSAVAARRWRTITISAGGGLLASALIAANVDVVRPVLASPTPHRAAPEPVVRRAPFASPSPPSARNPLRERPAAVVPTRPAAADAAKADAIEADGIQGPLTEAPPAAPLALSRRPVDLMTTASAPAVANEPRVDHAAPPTRTRAADFGGDVGRVSQRTGTATAGFFSRFGKKLAAAF
jgi:beta-lactamase regulating signal transducer with metallopeptidase domain